jgi:hypothetical protein
MMVWNGYQRIIGYGINIMTNFQDEDHELSCNVWKGNQPYITLACSLQDVKMSKMAANLRWESSILSILNALELYAKLHKYTYETLIGEDCIFGPVFESMLENMRELLNGELGRLDAGSLLFWMRSFAKENKLEWPE